jgi:TRAP-type mannitol/chloroaromatic compound transport system permease small subunit
MQQRGWIDTLSTRCGQAIAWLVVPLALIVTYEVGMRYLLNRPTEWVYDVSWMLHGTAFMLGGAYTLSLKRHVRIDMVYGQLSPRGQVVFDLVIFAVVVLPIMAVLTWKGVVYAVDAWQSGERLSTSTWQFPSGPAKTMVPIGFALMLLQTGAEVARRVRDLRRGGRP